MLGTISSFHTRFNDVERHKIRIFSRRGSTAQIGSRSPRFEEVFRSHTIRHTHTRARARWNFSELLSARRKGRY